MTCAEAAYYRPDLALVHHFGFGFHADACAPGILELLAPVRERGGLVVEVGCGSGLLTKYLVDAGHRVIATDASDAMLDLARRYVRGAEDIRRVVLPHDPIPEADAIVGVGHPLNYLPDRQSLDQALVAIAGALRPGGVMATDLCDLAWGEARRDQPNYSQVSEDWAIITRFALPTADRYVRELTTFVRHDDGSWRRDDEHHDNVLLDTAAVPPLLARHGVTATVQQAFGTEALPEGLHAIVGWRTA